MIDKFRQDGQPRELQHRDIVISPLERVHIPMVAALFVKELKGSFVADLGVNFLRDVYLPFLFSRYRGLCYVALRQGEFVGFILGGPAGGFYGRLLQSSFFPFSGAVLHACLQNPLLLTRIIDILLVMGQDPDLSHKSKVGELLFMAVEKTAQRSGIGGFLLAAFENALRNEGFEKALVQTMQNTPWSQMFYLTKCYNEIKRARQRIWYIKDLRS